MLVKCGMLLSYSWLNSALCPGKHASHRSCVPREAVSPLISSPFVTAAPRPQGSLMEVNSREPVPEHSGGTDSSFILLQGFANDLPSPPALSSSLPIFLFFFQSRNRGNSGLLLRSSPERRFKAAMRSISFIMRDLLSNAGITASKPPQGAKHFIQRCAPNPCVALDI